MKKVFFALLLLLPFLLMSQTPLIEPSWELMPGDGPIDKDNFLPLDIMEFNDGCYLVPVSMEKEKAIKFVKIDNDGGILQETVLQYDENSIISTFLLDMYNDTVNVFTIHISEEDGSAMAFVKHIHIYEDLSLSEENEIWRKELDGVSLENMELNLFPDNSVLIDDNGCRTLAISFWNMREDMYSHILLKLDYDLNIISEKIYDNEYLNNYAVFGGTFTYNGDSTQYYCVSYTPNNPYYYFMNVFDMDLNLTEQIRFDSDPSIYLQSLFGYWCQNPYDGKIYTLGQVTVPNAMYGEIVAVKIDIDNDNVDFLRLSYTSDEIDNVVYKNKNLCFLPDGRIVGCAIYDIADLYQYKPGGYYAYIPVFDANMKKISEWYYTQGEIYNQLVHTIYSTKDDDIILLGSSRFKIDEEILWEPYIVKFPASAFDPDNIEEAHAHGLHLAVAYPNPGGDVMNIRTALRNATLSVYDMQGRIVHEQEITDDVTSIDASRWNSGTYIWKLTINNEQFTIKEVESGKWVKD